MATVALLVALRDGRYKGVALGNERSASFGNGTYKGVPVNHQHDKSLAYEAAFAEYIDRFVTRRVKVHSGLSHLWEVQIAERFAGLPPEVHKSFISCNVPRVMSRGGGTLWCATCYKCVFVYGLFSAFMQPDELREEVFYDEDPFEGRDGHVFALLGLNGDKPPECVGVPEEYALALWLARKAWGEEAPAVCGSAEEKVAAAERYAWMLHDTTGPSLTPRDWGLVPEGTPREELNEANIGDGSAPC